MDMNTPETDAEAITPSGFEADEVSADFARKLERERDEAREAFVIATDQMVQAQCKLRESNTERDEARENMDQEMKFHHRTHSELIENQCKLLDMEMKCDQLQDEIKRLKVILDLIKKDVS